MAEARRQEPAVVEMIDYLRATISDIDETMAEWAQRRKGLSMRLAVLEAAESPLIDDAEADYEARVAEDRPYEDARDAEDVLSEAHRRFGS